MHTHTHLHTLLSKLAAQFYSKRAPPLWSYLIENAFICLIKRVLVLFYFLNFDRFKFCQPTRIDLIVWLMLDSKLPWWKFRFCNQRALVSLHLCVSQCSLHIKPIRTFMYIYAFTKLSLKFYCTILSIYMYIWDISSLLFPGCFVSPP